MAAILDFLSLKILIAANFASSILEMNSSHPKTPVLIKYMQLCNNMCGKYIFGNTDGGHIGFLCLKSLMAVNFANIIL